MEAQKDYMKLRSWGSIDSSLEAEWNDEEEGRMKRIVIYHQGHVNGIQTIREKDNSFRFSKRHGGNHGKVDIIHLERPLTWMSGVFTSSGISSLKFGNDVVSYGPFGETWSGCPFSYKGVDEIVGFHGWSNDHERKGYISSLGPYIKLRCNPSVAEKN